MSWIRRETEKETVQYICPHCHDYHEFREDFGERTFSENYIFCRRCGARNGTGNAPTLTPPNKWVSRLLELDELYTKVRIVTGFTVEQLVEMFTVGYTLEKPDYSKASEEMASLAETVPPNEPLDALEKLQAENEKLRGELEQVKQERDAAVEDIPHECKTCLYHTVSFNGCTLDHDCTNLDGGCSNNYDRWQWRGQKEG